MSSAVIRRVSVLVLAVVLAAGCTGDEGNENPAPDGDDARVVEHQYGETEVSGAPERVVSLGEADADPLLALGVKPIAIRPGYGVDDVGPWAEDKLGRAKPKILPSGGAIDVAEVAALDPDLIIAISTPVDRKTYDRLSKIAPTVVRPEGSIDYGVSWEVSTTMIGLAVGRTDEAESVIEKTKVAISDTLRENPRIDGTTGEVVTPARDGGWSVSTPVHAPGQFLFELGVNPPPKLARRDGGKRERIRLNANQTNDLEADVVLAVGDRQAQRKFKTSKQFQRLAVVRRDGVVRVPEESLGQALSYTSVLSIPFALDRLAPPISEALD